MLTQHLAGMTAIPQWFIWRLTYNHSKGKYDKAPCAPDGSVYAMDAADPANWLPYDTALAHLARLRLKNEQGIAYVIGFRFTKNCGYWFLDIDGCVVDGKLTEWANWFYQSLPNAFFEYSSSGKGVHFIGRGQVPEHRTRPSAQWKADHKGVDLEFYTDGRGIAFGLSEQGYGNADTDHTPLMQWTVANIFPVMSTGECPELGLSGARSDWRGPTDDDDLIRRASQSRSAGSMFQGKASFADLWMRNVAALALSYPYTGDKNPPDPYGQSDADMALIAHLAFWTGCDAARMERLMWRSGLVREKWTEHKTYLATSIAGQCAMQRTVCVDKEVAQALPVVITAQESAINVGWMARIGEASEEELRNVVVPQIAQDTSIASLDRGRLAQLVMRKFKEMGFPVSISQCREMLSVKTVDIEGGAGSPPDGVQRFVYVTEYDKFYDTERLRLMTPTSFNAKFNRAMPQRPNGDREDTARWCLERWGTPIVADVLYWPGRDILFEYGSETFANLYSTSTVPVAAEAYTHAGVAAIEAFIKQVRAWCGERPEVYTGLFDWMAWCVQNPGKKCRYAPLLKGIQGDGKSLLTGVLRAAMGDKHVSEANSQMVSSPFNDWAAGSCVTVLEEVMLTGKERYGVANQIKELITNDVITLNRKGRTGLKCRNVTNYMALTNHTDAMPLEDNDRRWWVLFSPFVDKMGMVSALGFQTIEQLDAHFELIWNSLTTHRAEWRKYLSEYPVSGAFKPQGSAPYTREKGEMRESGEDPLDAIARQCIADGGIGVGADVLSSNALTSLMRGICVQDGHVVPQGSAVSRMLVRLGFTSYGSLWWEGRTHRIWWKRGAVQGEGVSCVRNALDVTKAHITVPYSLTVGNLKL